MRLRGGRITKAMCCAAAAVIAGCGSSSSSSSQTSSTSTGTSGRQFSPAVQAKLRQVVQSYVGNGKYPGLVVAVSAPNGSFVDAAGYSDLATHTPMSTSENFRIGSITKTFTASVILQLAQQGKLSLSDPLSKYEPQIPNASRITIRQLLNHTSGLRHGGPSNYFQHPQQSPTPQQEIANTTSQPLLSAPGTAYHYSDVGYLILGEVAQKVTGTDIGTLIQRQILTPLGMHHTVYAPNSGIPSPTAHGNVYANGKPTDATSWSFTYTGSAGGLSSTLGDMEIWAPALATGKGILGPAVQQQRVAGMVTAGPGLTYGLGVFEITGFLGHDGEVPGYDSVVLYQPASKTTVIVLGNLSPLLSSPPQNSLETFPNVATALVQAIS